MGAAQKRCCWSRLLVGFRRTPLSLAPKQEGAEPQPAGQHISRSTKRRRVRPHRHLCSRVQTQEGNEGLSEIACSARLRVGLGVAVVGDPWSPRTRTSPCLGCGLAAAAAATTAAAKAAAVTAAVAAASAAAVASAAAAAFMCMSCRLPCQSMPTHAAHQGSIFTCNRIPGSRIFKVIPFGGEQSGARAEAAGL